MSPPERQDPDQPPPEAETDDDQVADPVGQDRRPDVLAERRGGDVGRDERVRLLEGLGERAAELAV